MALPSISSSTRSAISDIDALEKNLAEISSINFKFQFLIAELMAMRLFAIVEGNLADTAFKLAAGASYTNGVAPRLLISRCRSVAHSKTTMESLNRPKPIWLSWTQIKDIKDATSHVLVSSDFFITNLSNYGQLLNDMRKVRNYVAHKNPSSRKKFKEVIRSTYSLDINLQAGAFLLSTTRHSISNLQRYLRSSKVMLQDVSKGS